MTDETRKLSNVTKLWVAKWGRVEGPLECEKETAQFYVIGGRRVSKHSGYESYFKLEREAWEYLAKRERQQIAAAEQTINGAKRRLVKIDAELSRLEGQSTDE